MAITVPPARLHLLTALDAPRAVIIRRKPSKRFHIMLWNTRTDAIDHGSWFRGTIYSYRSDLSPDGKWMCYFAMGDKGQVWNALCKPPRLTAIAQWNNLGTYYGGGYFDQAGSLLMNVMRYAKGQTAVPEVTFPEGPTVIPRLTVAPSPESSEDEGVLYARMRRDGWERAGPFGVSRKIKGSTYRVACDGDAGWTFKPTSKHPTLRAFYRGYFGGHKYEFALDEFPEILDRNVQWATWDSQGSLLVARLGGIERYTRTGLRSGIPAFALSLESLAPPSRLPAPPKE